MADDFSKPPPNKTAEHNQALFRQQEQARELKAEQDRSNSGVVQQRKEAPGSIQSGSEQEAFVRQEAVKAEQQKLVEGAYGKGQTKDQYAGAREEAIKSGSFDYSSYRNEKPSSLPSIVTPKGVTETRNQDLYHGSPADLQNISGKSTTQPKEETVIITTNTGEKRTVKGEQALIERLQSNYLQSTPKPTAKSTAQPKPQPEKTTSILLQNLVNKEKQTVSDISGKRDNEAVPFLSLEFPIKTTVVQNKPGTPEKNRGHGASQGSGQHVELIIPQHETQGTKEIPYTSITDVLQFAPIGGVSGLPRIGTAIKESGSIIGTIKASSGVFKTGSGLERVSERTITVPKGIKPPEETLLGKIQSTFSNTKNTGGISNEIFNKMTAEQKAGNEVFIQRTGSKPSNTEISLGRGTGKLVSKGGKGGFESTKPGGGSGTKPSSGTPKESTSRSGQVLQQIEKEKEPKTATKTETKTEQINKALGKEKEQEATSTKGRGKVKTETTEEQIPILITKTTPKQGKKGNPLIPTTIVIPVPPQPKSKPRQPERLAITDLVTTKLTQGQKQPQEGLLTTDTVTTQVTRGTPKQTQDQNRISDIVYTEKGGNEPAILSSGGVGGNPGLIGKVSSGGRNKNFLGNVPLDDIIGIGKQNEVTYKESTIKTRTASEERRASSGSFVGGGSKSKMRLF